MTRHFVDRGRNTACGRDARTVTVTGQVFGVTCRKCLKRMVRARVNGARARLDELKATDRGETT